MAYAKTTWVDRSVEKPLTYTQVVNGDSTITLTPAEGTVITAGTELLAANLNNIENGIETVDTALTTHKADTTAHESAKLYAYKNIGGTF